MRFVPRAFAPWTKFVPSSLQTSSKKIRVGDFSGQKLGRVGKPETQVYFFGLTNHMVFDLKANRHVLEMMCDTAIALTFYSAMVIIEITN